MPVFGHIGYYSYYSDNHHTNVVTTGFFCLKKRLYSASAQVNYG